MADPTQTEFALRNWRHGQFFAESLGAILLHLDGYEGIDPQCPLGGPDGSKDIISTRDGCKWIGAVYFPPTDKTFGEIKAKFASDLEGALNNGAGGFAFLVNQKVTPTQRVELQALGSIPIEIYHLQRMSSLLSNPKGFGARLEYLKIPMSTEEQVDFFSAVKYELTKQLIEQQNQLYRVHDKLDILLARTASMHADLMRGHSSIQDPLPEFAMDMPTSRLSLPMLSWLHRILTERQGTSDATRGRLRSVQNWLASPEKPDEILYRPPPPEEVPARLNQFLTWWQELHPRVLGQPRETIIEALAEFHRRLLQIHPFLDANGRLARILLDQAAIELLAQKIGNQIVEDAGIYYAALRNADRGDYLNLRRLIAATLQ